MSRLLVVEDSDALRFAMREFFQNRGYTVDEASSLAEALRHIARRSYAAVLLDWSLTPDGAEGAEVLRYLRGGKVRKPPLAVVVTALRDAEVERMARSLGAQHVLWKPVDLSQLAALLPPPRPTSAKPKK
ncbi:MAG: response regulator [Candidatus Binatia bacterium]|nr:response regulator [Candidatus Binatia bacterium]